MVEITINEPEGIAVIEPQAPLEAADFNTMAKLVDDYLKTSGK